MYHAKIHFLGLVVVVGLLASVPVSIDAAQPTRPNILLAAPFLVGWILHETLKPAAPRRRAAWVAVACAAGIAAAIAPVTIRNYVVSRRVVPIAWQAGTNFYIGNNPQANGAFRVPNEMQNDLAAASLRVAVGEAPHLVNDTRLPLLIDQGIYTLLFDDDQGDPFATLVVWGNHPESLGSDNTVLTSDYPHYLRRALERDLPGVDVGRDVDRALRGLHRQRGLGQVQVSLPDQGVRDLAPVEIGQKELVSEPDRPQIGRVQAAARLRRIGWIP